MKALGRVINVVHTASGKHISLANASGVTFSCYEDGGAQAITIKESVAGASEQALEVVTELYASDGIGGVFTRETTDANGALGTGDAAIVKKDTTAFDGAVFYIGADELSDGFDSVEVTVDGGTCVAIVHDLAVQRAPQNLPAAAV
jgi:hypothetical protein